MLIHIGVAELTKLNFDRISTILVSHVMIGLHDHFRWFIHSPIHERVSLLEKGEKVQHQL